MARMLPRRISIHFDADEADAKFQNWKGTPDVGWELTKALQHSKELEETYQRRPVNIAHRIVNQIFDLGIDPKSHPQDENTKAVWTQMPKAIEAADSACQHIMRAYSPDDTGAMKALWHADNLYFSLTEAEFLVYG